MESRIKVLNVCINDWANFSYNNAMSLRSIGIESRAIKMVKHRFGYEEQAEVVGDLEMLRMIKNSDVVQFVHGDIKLFEKLLPFLEGKKISVIYTGTSYRNKPEEHNQIFNLIVDVSFTDQCEFMNLGAKNLNYIATAIDIDKFNNNITRPEPILRVRHYPSDSSIKGTEEIVDMMEEICGRNDANWFDFYWCKGLVSHQEQIQRMSDCDIYIELFKPELNGKPYGVHGVTAFEAAALGCVVITQNIYPEVYKKAYGDHPLHLANTEESFRDIVYNLVNWTSIDDVYEMKKKSRQWIIDKHSFEATGKYLLDIWKRYL
ncbi:MAG: hypothetical protein A3F91_15255 [Flavobacteria bacterium RIFCSPLOWO2_12_FULL_35_11]|nr:MAG: hypothetical protein A3F91_15255 [Flavobacteria bacterium RIFCSPLOWO2_12_FULL_35_11]